MNTVSEGLSDTVLGSEFQMEGAEWWKPQLAKSVQV